MTRMKKGSSKVILAIRAIRSVLDDQVLALNSPNGSLLSAAYFDPDDRKIYVLEETKDTWGWDLASLCKLALGFTRNLSADTRQCWSRFTRTR